MRDLYPYQTDFSTDLRQLGLVELAEHIAAQLDPADLRWLVRPCPDAAARVA